MPDDKTPKTDPPKPAPQVIPEKVPPPPPVAPPKVDIPPDVKNVFFTKPVITGDDE